MAPSRDCPCFSGLRYRACCAPFHTNAREAETAEALMRSRYAAFALGLGDYLLKTLAASHPDREHDANGLVQALSRVREKQRFMGLRVLWSKESGDRAEVLFYARLFEKGRDVSLAELSLFTREDGGWRYASGILLPHEKLPSDPAALTYEEFLARTEGIAPA